MNEIDNWDIGKAFKIRLLLIHPSMEPNEVTSGLRVTPSSCKGVGQARSTPHGDPLPGVYPDTRWQAVRNFKDTGRFFVALMEVFEEIVEPNGKFMERFIGTGGYAVLTVDAKGTVNIGDVLSITDMRRLAAAGVQVGLEVFP